MLTKSYTRKPWINHSLYLLGLFVFVLSSVGCSLDSRIQNLFKSSTETPVKPTLEILSPANHSDAVKSTSPTIALSGSCSEEGQTITITPAATAPVVCTSGTWQAVLDLTHLEGPSLQVTVTIANPTGQSTDASLILNIFDSPIKKFVTGFLGFSFALLTVDNRVISGPIHTYDDGFPVTPPQEVSLNAKDILGPHGDIAILKNDSSVYSFPYNQSSPESLVASNISKIFRSSQAFAALKNDSSVTVWGEPSFGGSMGGSGDAGTSNAWAGAPFSVTAAGSGVIDIFSNRIDPVDFVAGDVFVALKNDGSVVAWGNLQHGGAMTGGDSEWSSVPASVKTPASGIKVTRVFNNEQAFAALKSDGSVAVWGKHAFGGATGNEDAGDAAWNGAPDSVTNPGSGVVEIFSTHSAFAALKQDGSIVTWGSIQHGGAMGGNGGAQDTAWFGAPSSITSPSANPKKVFSSSGAFAVLKSDGSVVTWGSALHGGSMSIDGNASYAEWAAAPASATNANSNIVNIFQNKRSFAAIKQDGSVVVWGALRSGGSMGSNTANWNGAPSSITAPGSGVVKIFSNPDSSFAALKADGSIVAWGNPTQGGSMGGADGAPASVTDANSGVVKIVFTSYTATALKADGSLISWGGYNWNIKAPTELSAPGSVIDVVGDGRTNIALKADGSFTAWGRDEL